MKGGLAVMLDLATTVRRPAVDVTWCFYAREEIGRADSGLLELWREAARTSWRGTPPSSASRPARSWRRAARARCGCASRCAGVRAHTARPFTGRNAIHRLAPLLQRVADWPGREVVLDGCTYAEQLQAVAVEGGVAANVVPDEARVTLNHRYAPDRDASRGRGLPARAPAGDLGPREPATPGRCSTPATARRRRSATRCCTRWWRRAAPRPRPRWAGPTWPRSGSTGCRPPTSGPATRSWPTTPTSGCRRRSSSAAHEVLLAPHRGIARSPDDDRAHHVLVDVADVAVRARPSTAR